MNKILGFLCLVAAVASISAFVTLRISNNCSVCSGSATTCASHDWLHDRLELTAEQKKALEPIEQRFHEQYNEAGGRLTAANQELAKILGQSDSFSPEVAAAIEKVHHRMGDLQKLSIQHVYEMKAVLTPEQNRRLVQYAQQALENSH